MYPKHTRKRAGTHTHARAHTHTHTHTHTLVKSRKCQMLKTHNASPDQDLNSSPSIGKPFFLPKRIWEPRVGPNKDS